MILRELFYIDQDTRQTGSDLRYRPRNDDSKLRRGDTRKTRLTLRQINELRKASEAHLIELESERDFIKTMYANPAAAPPM